MDRLQLYGRAILGVVVAVFIWNGLAATNAIEFLFWVIGWASGDNLEDGKLGNVSVFASIPWVEIGVAIWGWALFVFGRLGDSAIAAVRAALGFEPAKSSTKSNAEASADVTEAFRRFYDAYQAKRQHAVESAGANLDQSMQSILSEVTQRVEQ